MATLLSVLVAASTLVGAQDFGGGNTAGGAFQYVQPLDTVILDEHNSSPPVYPSRKFLFSFSVQNNQSNNAQLMQPESEAGKMHL